MTPSPTPSTPEFDVLVTENVMVRMRDGTRLATDIYRPAIGGKPVDGRLPVLLHRTPYNEQRLGAVWNHKQPQTPKFDWTVLCPPGELKQLGEEIVEGRKRWLVGWEGEGSREL